MLWGGPLPAKSSLSPSAIENESLSFFEVVFSLIIAPIGAPVGNEMRLVLLVSIMGNLQITSFWDSRPSR